MTKSNNCRIGMMETSEGINREEDENPMYELNEFFGKQSGLISRRISLFKDGQYLDLLVWTDLESVTTSSKKVMDKPKTLKAYEVIDEKIMTFRYLSIFNEILE
ncbi:hypothetical protein D2V08_12940 [Flagellimonas lutimaris]|uniref:ABM domain-containing protein n=1 Tax=Flagellimonas lutimaris TaxID=475082 RepID=A0A3A1N752_9FLAO|nr:hypothetical protein [Allomuricauda lutimaris]RIV31657.1 hypothetical protein D2V08_12940 [Allomuricauda lutimaris]